MSNPNVRWFGVKDSEEGVEEEDPWAYDPWTAFMTGKPLRKRPSLEENMREKMFSKPVGEAKFWGKGFPKLPPKQVIPMPKMSPKEVQKAAKITLNPFAFQAITHTAKEAKNKIEEEANALMQKLTYPEPLINEAVNRYLSRF